MSILKRISTTFVSRVDHLLGELENHDALIQASIEKMQRKISVARVRAKQMHREHEKLQKDIDRQQQQVTLWRDRAKKTAQQDEAKALICLQRAHDCERQLSHLQQTETQYQQHTLRLQDDLGQFEQLLADMKHKQKIMRARQANGEVRQTVESTDDAFMLQIDEAFDRWEMHVGVSETETSFTTVDAVDKEFSEQELTTELKAELAALLQLESSHE